MLICFFSFFFFFFFFCCLKIVNIPKVDTEAERQGEILAFYGEEEARTCGSPNPGPAVEKDDAPMKPTVTTEEKVSCLGIRKPLCTECWVIDTDHTTVVQVLLSYDPYGPACTFIAKLLRKSPYEGRTQWREQDRNKPSSPHRITYGSL